MKTVLTVLKITFGDFIRRTEVLIIAILGIVFIAGVSMVLLDEELAKQVAAGVERSQSVDVQKSTFVEGALVYAELFTIIISFLVGMNLIGKDIKTNAIALYLVKPISRLQYLFGKYLGAVSLSLMIFLIYELFLLLTLQIDGSGLSFPFFKILFITLFKVSLLYSMILMLVQKLPGFVASLIATAIYLTGYFAGDFFLFAISAKGLLKIGSLAIYYTLPHMVQVSPGSIMGSAGRIAPFIEWAFIYGLLYSGLWLFGGMVLFRKRAL
ncbi:MAG: ABC-2 transporter permease [Candidatus Marinimicrobia bacterium]|nr:ABC-2 transporter permease [Candidatus Neomarinimicrobiota bacterium]MCH7955823.1 ABC-2 transporter permease [Candidatus Neomarinimicrobiota bacterium]